ncbi:uroporphyrinogen-III C-methyltransferase [Marinobacter zhanjiangensis]|uniref:uroporphyrinogen-III C-methyltransferase n=1 Tax=Marinobacter zhanjiangensis TaxID=578215 RepID=A0ABQ3B4L1_9GAMM|nr:uroporphyrinogen-III C-methyltransferase [Marinobacter zhanjiangensis]
MSTNPRKKCLVEFQLAEQPLKAGEVAIVGAGPGDPGLLTLRALMLIQQADAVVYDRLVSPEIMELVNPAAEHIHVGKASGCHYVPQEDTNELLVQLAVRQHRVVRLKGGDPYIFGRGGEEAEFLVENDIDFQVVPGITSAAGCASYCGIPLTHRDYAQSVTFVTGHRKADQALELNWQVLAAPGQTRVFYMGLHNAPTIVRELTAHGLPGDCPVALVERGTTPQQHMAVTTLSELEATIIREGFQPPTLIIVGEVVKLAQSLAQPARSGWTGVPTQHSALSAGGRPA